MLLWKDTFRTAEGADETDADSDQPWHLWPRPSGGFLDLG